MKILFLSQLPIAHLAMKDLMAGHEVIAFAEESDAKQALISDNFDRTIIDGHFWLFAEDLVEQGLGNVVIYSDNEKGERITGAAFVHHKANSTSELIDRLLTAKSGEDPNASVDR